MSRKTPRFTFAMAACGLAFACAGSAHAADPTIIIRAERDGPCGPSEQPLAVTTGERFWVAGFCSGIYVQAFTSTGVRELVARRQDAPTFVYGDAVSAILPRSDGSAWLVGTSGYTSSQPCALMRPTPQGTIEVVQPAVGCRAVLAANDAVVTVRVLADNHVRTEKFSGDGTLAWARDSIVETNGSALPMVAANGTIHVLATSRTMPRVALVSYRADGTPLAEVLTQLGDQESLVTGASGSGDEVFAAASVYEAGIGFHLELVAITAGVGVHDRATLPPIDSRVAAILVSGGRPVLVETTRNEQYEPDSVTLTAYDAELETSWTHTFDEIGAFAYTATAVASDGAIALAINPSLLTTQSPRLAVIGANGSVFSDVRTGLPAKTSIQAMTWLQGGDLAIAAGGISTSNPYRSTDEFLVARVGSDGGVRWSRAEGTVTQSTTVNGIFPGAGGKLAVITTTPKPNPPPVQPLDPIVPAFRVDVFDASGASTLSRELPLSTGGVVSSTVLADGSVVQLTMGDPYVTASASISRLGPTPALDWAHPVADAYGGEMVRMANGDFAYAVWQGATWKFGAIGSDGAVRFESPLSPPIPAAPSRLGTNASGGVDVAGAISFESTSTSLYCGSFDALGVAGPATTVTLPVGYANVLEPPSATTLLYATTPSFNDNSLTVGRVSCAGDSVWQTPVAPTSGIYRRSVLPDGAGGAWIVDARGSPLSVRARRISALGVALGDPQFAAIPFIIERYASAPDGRLAVAGFFPGTDSCGTVAMAEFGPTGNLAWTWVHDRAPQACESWLGALVADGADWLIGTELRQPGQPAAAQVIRVSGRLFSNGFE